VSKVQRIVPRTLKGFRDFLPEVMIPRERLMGVAREVYRSYGFSPIDTPALEYLEVLTGKGGEESDKQMYRFTDHGGRLVGMRFDLTVPLARFAAQHVGQLGTPFKRYHIATVWRGENTQRGRYREFMQCDFDTIGTESVASDIETSLVIHDLLREIDKEFGTGEFTIRVSNRQVLSGLLERFSLAQQTTSILRSLDKLPKIGPEKVALEMATNTSGTQEQIEQILQLAQLPCDSQAILSELATLAGDNELANAGVQRLRELVAGMDAAGVPSHRIQIDPSIARGLDYYTGTIYETFLDDLPGIGSVCSGGRYDNLAEVYTKQHLPGIGASLGLDRLLAAIEEMGLSNKGTTPAEVLIVYFDPGHLHDYLRLATQLRRGGVRVEMFPEPKKLGQQLKYADRRGFPLALIAGQEEFDTGECQLKELATGQSTKVAMSISGGAIGKEVGENNPLVAAIREMLH